ncbi:MAG TPA: hypothetical protein VFW75_14265 [Acetobacteraceae bacterium]|nr:hypothetical protein [Acetobacteraceae bacterium]
MQLPIGFAIGLLGTVFPSLLRPFVVAGVALLGIEALLLFRTGGADALAAELGWLAALVQSAALGLAGVGVGRWSGEIIFGHS